MDNKSTYKYLLSDLSALKGVGVKTANLLKKGKTIATVQGSIFDKDDKLAATLMHTIFIFNRTERFNKDKS